MMQTKYATHSPDRDRSQGDLSETSNAGFTVGWILGGTFIDFTPRRPVRNAHSKQILTFILRDGQLISSVENLQVAGGQHPEFTCHSDTSCNLGRSFSRRSVQGGLMHTGQCAFSTAFEQVQVLIESTHL